MTRGRPRTHAASSELRRVAYRLPAELVDALRTAAQDRGCSQSSILVSALEWELSSGGCTLTTLQRERLARLAQSATDGALHEIVKGIKEL